jgi:hypothetical protein
MSQTWKLQSFKLEHLTSAFSADVDFRRDAAATSLPPLPNMACANSTMVGWHFWSGNTEHKTSEGNF